MQYEQILFEQRGHVGLVTLNRPDKRNAWTNEMWQEVVQAMDGCVAEPTIGAIVVTGAGVAFCAGADIGGFKERTEAQDRGDESTGFTADQPSALRGPHNFVEYLQKLPKPTIAAINGVAVGIGCTLTLPMDIRIASESARMGFFFVRMGLVPELASSKLLPGMVGSARAREWCLTGRLIEPAEAQHAGMVAEVVPPERLIDRALEIGELLAGYSQPSMAMIRQLLIENPAEDDIQTVLARETEFLQRASSTWEHREAIAAFFEKRAPDFTKKG